MKECAGKLFGRIGARLKKGAVIGTGAVLIASQVLSVVPGADHGICRIVRDDHSRASA